MARTVATPTLSSTCTARAPLGVMLAADAPTNAPGRGGELSSKLCGTSLLTKRYELKFLHAEASRPVIVTGGLEVWGTGSGRGVLGGAVVDKRRTYD